MTKEVAAEINWEEEMLAALGTVEERLERKKRADAALQFILDHTEEWREQYPNHWIAVSGSRLVAAESSRRRLMKAVTDNGLDFKQVQTRFITEEPRVFPLYR